MTSAEPHEAPAVSERVLQTSLVAGLGDENEFQVAQRGRFDGAGFFPTIQRGRDYLYGTTTWAAEKAEISGGVLKATKTFIEVDTETSSPTDDLDTLTIQNQRKGMFALLKTQGDLRDPTLKHATGNLKLTGGIDFTMLTTEYYIWLIYDGSNWIELLRSGPTVGLEAVNSYSSNQTLTTADSVVLVDASGGAVTITLPAIDVAGRKFSIKKIDSSANAVTIDGDGSETIDDTLTKVLSMQYDSVTVVCDASEWWIV